MSDGKLRLKPFNLDKIEPGALVAVIGRRFSGKSWAIRSILHIFGDRGVPYGAIFSGTEHCSPFFQDYFPDSFIYTEEDFSDERIKEILDQQAALCQTYKEKIKDCICYHCKKNPYNYDFRKGHCIHSNLLLITDDMMSQERLLKKSSNYRKLFTEGRHYNINYFLCLQYALGLPPTLRTNMDYIFLYGEDEVANLKKLYENYAGVIPDFNMFRNILDQCTEDFGCLVIDKRSKSKKLEDRIFFFKASDPGDFKFGSRKMWKAHEENIRSQHSTKESKARRESQQFKMTMQNRFEKYGDKSKRVTVIMDGRD